MEYNQELFGEKRTIYQFINNVYTRLFEIGSQNISVEQGFNSGVFTLNAELPADLALWEIGEDSVLTRLTWHKKDNDNNRITHHSLNKERVKMMLATNSARINTTTYDVNTSGSIYYDTTQCNYRNVVSQSNFNPVQQYPMWNPLVGVSGNAPHFSVTPFIMDFDYSGVLLCVWVRTMNNIDYTLKDFIDNHNGDTNIAAVYVVPYFGTATNHTAPSSTRFENGTSNINVAGIHLVNSKTYDLPTNLKPEINVVINNFIMASKLVTQYNLAGNTWTILDYSISTTSYRASYYQDDEVWDENGLIPHGENNEYNQDDINYILKQIALLGFWFTSDNTNITTRVTGENCTDANTYLPEIKDGITTGKYWAGTAAAEQDAAKWANDWRDRVNYQPGSVTPTGESSKSSKTMYESTFASFGRIYKCFPPSATYPNGTIQSLADQLRSYMFSGNYDGSLFYNQNPVDCITSIKEYPFDISDYIETLGTELIQLGRWRVQTSDRPELYCPFVRIKSSSTPIFYGSLSIPSSFKTIGYEFLDYEPYSKYDLYLPFCGTINIPSALAVETLIEVLYFIDLLSGCCIAHIYIDNKYYCSAQGQVAVEIPVSGYQIGNYTRDMLNATYAQKQAYANVASDVGRLITSIGGSAIGMGINSKVGYGGSNPITIPDPVNPAMALFSGTAGGLVNAGQIISGAGKAIQAGAAMASHYETIKYNKSILSHSAPAPIKSSLGGGIINWESPYYVEMLVQRPIFMTDYDEETYKATLGKACHIADTLANHSGGYVEAINCNLSGFPATQPEKVELAKLLADGVFL